MNEIYSSMQELADVLNVSRTSIFLRINNKKEKYDCYAYYYDNDKEVNSERY